MRSPRDARTAIADLAADATADATVCGFVHAVRRHKAVQFVVVEDHTGHVQAVHRRDDDPDLAARIDGLTVGSAVTVSGPVLAAPRVRLGGIELRIGELRVAARAASPLPIDDRSGPELRLDHPWLALRAPHRRLVFEAQTVLLAAMREHWGAQGMIELHSPKLMDAPSESGAEVFALEYFGRRAYLSQSPQFFKQLAIAAGFDGVFEVGPVFRAEPSHTARHGTEFTGVDVELAWIGSHEDVMRHEEALLAHAVAALDRTLGPRLHAALGVAVAVPSLPFPRVTVDDARAWLQRATAWRPPPGDDGALDAAGERALSELVAESEGHGFVFVTDYPVTARPFYHLRPDDRPDRTRSFDLLAGGVEITTGAQREHRRARLAAQAAQAGLDPAGIATYLDTFAHGCPPHGGFGLGLERLTMALLGLGSIRDATFLPRTPTRLSP